MASTFRSSRPPDGQPPADYFRDLAREGLERRLAEDVAQMPEAERNAPEKYRDRLEYEIGVIEKMGFPSYFLIVSDFIRHAREKGIAVGPGRGSAAGSIVSWALRITEIDPFRYDLLFERFLNPERISMPDIDIDFCQARRGEVIEYVTKRYGRENVAQIVTFSQLKPKLAVRDVARVLSLPVALGDRIAKLVPDGPDVNFERAFRDSPGLKEAMASDESVAKVVRIAERLEGLSRHAGHARRRRRHRAPAHHRVPAALPDQQGRNHDAVRHERRREDGPAQDRLPRPDHARRPGSHGRRRARADGASSSISTTCRWTTSRPTSSSAPARRPASSSSTPAACAISCGGPSPACSLDLAALNALYRPGALDAGTVEDYVRRRGGTSRVTYPLPELEPVLSETLGILVYQEQVMRIAQMVAGYSLAEADLLRKAIGKKKREIMQAEAEKFIRKAVEHGTPKKKAQELWSLIEPFARYGFNKSHAVAYALVAYKTAYLKAHYPIDFFAANLSAEIGSTDGIVKVLGDCQESGIPVLPPDINESSESFAAAGPAIRFGLAAIKGVGEAAARFVLEERGKRPFGSFSDFIERLDSRLVNKRTLDALIAAGAFDSLGRNRATLAGASERALAQAARRREEIELGQSNLFGGLGAERRGRLDARRLSRAAPSGRWTRSSRAKRTRWASTSRASADALHRGDRAIRRGQDRRARQLGSSSRCGWPASSAT